MTLIGQAWPPNRTTKLAVGARKELVDWARFPILLVVVLVLAIGFPADFDYEDEDDDENEGGSGLCKERQVRSSAG
jgi:hypothetical protein